MNDFADDETMEVDDPSLEVDSELNETRESFFETPKKSSTPRKSAPLKSAKSLFREPRLPRMVFSCRKCPKKFRSENSLKKHLRSHVFKDAASQVVSRESVNGAFDASVDQVLTELIQENSGTFADFVSSFKEEHMSSPSLKCFKSIVRAVLCEGIVGKSILMPSAMWSVFLLSINSALNSGKRIALKEQLLTYNKNIPVEVIHPFVSEFSHKSAAAVTSILTRRMAESAGVQTPPEQRAVRSTDDFTTERDQSTAFHIFGFIVKHFFNKASSAKKSVYWKKVLDVIESRFVKGGVVLSCSEGIEAWTASVSRGRLTFVGENAFKFFIALAPVIQGMEERNGSLGHDEVLMKVSDSQDLLSLWDAVIGNALDQEDSFTFLTSVVKAVTNVMGVGIRDRRLNEEVSKGSVNVALRSSLAPRESAGTSKS